MSPFDSDVDDGASAREPMPGDPRGLLNVEWVMSSGRGGYAMGNSGYAPCRRYHGLLVVALTDPAGRFMMMPRMDEVLRTEHGDVDLTSAFFLPVDSPAQGLDVILDFRREPTPTWILEAGGRLLRRRLLPTNSAQGIRISYELIEGDAALLLLRPLFTTRDHHSLKRKRDFNPRWTMEEGRLRWAADEKAPEIWFEHSGAVLPDPAEWHEGVYLPEERARGYDFVEDLHAPARIALKLEGQGSLVSVVAAVKKAPPPVLGDPRLPRAAGRFVFRHPGTDLPGVIAGFPWFTEWARDTMIALPGLFLAHGAYDTALEILLAWAGRLKGGLLPNRLEEVPGQERSNAADAPLFFLRAVALLKEHVPDAVGQLRPLWPAVAEILDAYLAGTDHGIRVEKDGLLRAGAEGLALTWMDAILPNGRAVTPRAGKPIELNALLLLGLRFGVQFARVRQDSAREQRWQLAADRLALAMGERFRDPNGAALKDVVDPDHAMEGPKEIRPNQLFALLIEPSPFPAEVRRAALDQIDANLLTPMGLRTLQAEHPSYCGRYGGTQEERDRAYHQGTVWPWLIAPWTAATLRIRGAGPKSRAHILERLTELFYLLESTGQVAEVFDGEAPHAAGGAPTQAWSVAAVAWARHILP